MKSFTEIAMFLYRKREVAATPPLTIFREIKTTLSVLVQYIAYYLARHFTNSLDNKRQNCT